MASAQPGYPPNGSYYHQNQASQSSRYSSMGSSRYHSPYRSPSMSDMRNAPTPGVHPAPTPGIPPSGSFRGVLVNPNDPGARAWDEYYMKGGTDPAGLVYYYPETVQGFPQSAPQTYPSHMSDRPNERAPYPYQGHQLPPQHQVRERVPSGSYHHHAFQSPQQHPHHAHSQSLPANSYPYSQSQQPLPNHQPFDVRPSPAPQQPPTPYGHPGSWPPPQPSAFGPSPMSNSPMSSPNRTPSSTAHQLPPSNYDNGANGPHPGPRVQPAPSPSYQSTPLPLQPQPQPQLPYQAPPHSDPTLTPASSNGSILSSFGSANIPRSPGRGAFSSLPSTSTTSISSVGSAGSEQSRAGSSRPLPTPAGRSSTVSVSPGSSPPVAQVENGGVPPRQPMNPEAAFAAVRARQAAAAAAAGRPLPSRSTTLPATPTPPVHPPINRPAQLPTPGAKVEGRRPLPSPAGPAPIDLKGKGKAKEIEADTQVGIHRRPLPSPVKSSFSGLGTSPVMASPITNGNSMPASSPSTDRPSQRPPLPPVPVQQSKELQPTPEERAAAAKAEAQKRMQEKLEKIRSHRWKGAGGDETLPNNEQTVPPGNNNAIQEASLRSSFSAKEEPILTLSEETLKDDFKGESSETASDQERDGSPDIPQLERKSPVYGSEIPAQSSTTMPKLGSFRRPLPPRITSSKPEPEKDSPVEPSPTKPDPTPTPVRSLPEKPKQPPSVRPASAFSSSRPARSPSAFGSRSQSAFEGARPSMTALASESSAASNSRDRPTRLSSPPRFTPTLPELSAASRSNASDAVNNKAPLSPIAVERPSYGFRSTPSTPGLTEGGETSSGTSVSDEVSTQASEEEEESSHEDQTPSQSRFRSNGRALPMPPPVQSPPVTPQREIRSPPETPRQRDRPSSAAPRHSMIFRMALEEQEEERRVPASPPTRNGASSASSPRNSFSSAPSSQRTPSPGETPRRPLPQPTKPSTNQTPQNNRNSATSPIDLDDQPPTSLHRNGSFARPTSSHPTSSRPTSSHPTSHLNESPSSTSSAERTPPAATETRTSAASKRFSATLAQKAAPTDDYTIPASSSRPLPSKPSISSARSNPKPTTPGSSEIPAIARVAPDSSRSNPKPAMPGVREVPSVIKITSPPSIPAINLPDETEEKEPSQPARASRRPSVRITAPPTISVEVADDTTPTTPSRPSAGVSNAPKARSPVQSARSGPPPVYRKGSLRCAGCDLLIVGKIVSAMDRRWHPACFKCSECGELLEHVSSYEHEGRPYCHLDYHDLFAPKCFHCKTAIADERFITVNDPGLDGGTTRYYHELHFFCAECGDPFLHPSASSAAPKGQKPRPHEVHHNDLGYTVYRGHAYCEACHVRLRMPKCAGCKKSIRDEVVEALDRKWHFYCFVCKSCKRPFEDPSFFQRGEDPYCDHCYSIIIKSEL